VPTSLLVHVGRTLDGCSFLADGQITGNIAVLVPKAIRPVRTEFEFLVQ